MVQYCAVAKMEANLWLLSEGMRLPFTAWQWNECPVLTYPIPNYKPRSLSPNPMPHSNCKNLT